MRFWHFTALILAGLMTTACLLGESVPPALQGTWETGGDNDGHSWYIRYSIDGSGYKMEGYPPVTGSGKIRLIEKKGPRYHLALSKVVFHGKSEKDRKVWVETSKKGAVLQWGSHALRKVETKKK